MRIVMDYRPALRNRSGVGEYVHQLATALRREYPDDELTLFTSSWKDRPVAELAGAVPGARVLDHRIPGRVLNLAWHNLEWPTIELLVGEAFDIAFSPHPLLLPARAAAQVVMVHDLDFLRHPERTEREIRRDYPRLAGAHGRRADGVIVPSQHTADEVHDLLGVSRRKITVCASGVPTWPDPERSFKRDGYLLFMGTLEPRKNLSGLLTAYEQLLAKGADPPKLVVAGKAGREAGDCLDRMRQPPLAGHVEFLGYIAEQNRQRVYAGARVFVLPSFEEGFGLPAVEAMSLGIPVVASARGGLLDLVRDAGILFDPTNHTSLADALTCVLADEALAELLSARGLIRASRYSWAHTAHAAHRAFAAALGERSSIRGLDAQRQGEDRRKDIPTTIRR